MVEHLEVGRKMQEPHRSCKVAVVNGSSDVIDLLETVLDAGQYDLAFVDASDRAYSEIKTMQPNLIVLCVRIEDLDGFHLLSMLKLDDETRQIPGTDLHDRIRGSGRGGALHADGRRPVHAAGRPPNELRVRTPR